MMPATPSGQGQGQSSNQGQGQGAIVLNIKWLGALFALWVILVTLANLSDTADLAVALAWLIAVSALIYIIDPAGVNILAQFRLSGGR